VKPRLSDAIMVKLGGWSDHSSNSAARPDSSNSAARPEAGGEPAVVASRSPLAFRRTSLASLQGSSTSSWRKAGRWKRLQKRIARASKEHQKQFKTGVGHWCPVVRNIVAHPAFDKIVAAIILANCLFIGIQVDAGDALGVASQVFEFLFTFSFFMDLNLRVIACGWTWLLERENYVDVFLVGLSVLVSWILTPIGLDVALLRKFTVLRMLRLVKLARSVRFRPEFKDCWALLKGLVDSFEMLLWTGVLICLFLYLYGILATSLIGKQEGIGLVDDGKLEEYFGDVPRSMLSLFQVMTFDSWVDDVSRPLMNSGQVWIGLFFIVFITMGDFVFMNLITASIVTNAFADNQKQDQELAPRLAAKKDQDLGVLQQILEDPKHGFPQRLTLDEMMAAAKKRKIKRNLLAVDVCPKDLEDIWDSGADAQGRLSPQEFVDVTKKLFGEAKAKDVLRLSRGIRILEASVRRMTNGLDTSLERMQSLMKQLDRAKTEIAAMKRTLNRAKETVKVAAKTQPAH